MKHHPASVDLELIKRLVTITKCSTLQQFLCKEFSNISKEYAGPSSPSPAPLCCHVSTSPAPLCCHVPQCCLHRRSEAGRPSLGLAWSGVVSSCGTSVLIRPLLAQFCFMRRALHGAFAYRRALDWRNEATELSMLLYIREEWKFTL